MKQYIRKQKRNSNHRRYTKQTIQKKYLNKTTTLILILFHIINIMLYSLYIQFEGCRLFGAKNKKKFINLFMNII